MLSGLFYFNLALIRKPVFGLLLTALRHKPCLKKKVYPKMLQSLELGTELILSDMVTEFAVLAMENTNEILRKVFEEGSKRNVSVANTIGRTIQLLSLLPTY